MALADEERGRLPVWGRPGLSAKARRIEGVVYRESAPWSDTVMRLLRHLREQGFTASPLVIGSGFDAGGAETLEFVEGACPHEPFQWSDEAAFQIGMMLRDLHRLSASFVPPADAVFRPWFGRDLPGTDHVFGHCDAGPYNVVARNGMPVAFIDWEFAGPTDAIWELAQTAWLNAQLHEVAFSDPTMDLPNLEGRISVLRAIVDGYGLSLPRRGEFVDRILEFIICSARAKGDKYGISPSASVGTAGDGQPVAWDILWRVKSASWVFRHKSILEQAIA